MRVKTLSLALIAAGLLAQPALAQRSTTDALGTLGGTSSYASGINASGQVAGSANTAGGAGHAFLYSGGAMQDQARCFDLFGSLHGDPTLGG